MILWIVTCIHIVREDSTCMDARYISKGAVDCLSGDNGNADASCVGSTSRSI